MSRFASLYRFFLTVKIMKFSTKSIVFYSRVIAITQLGEYNTRL
jgi:hypothetical protein